MGCVVWLAVEQVAWLCGKQIEAISCPVETVFDNSADSAFEWGNFPKHRSNLHTAQLVGLLNCLLNLHACTVHVYVFLCVRVCT